MTEDDGVYGKPLPVGTKVRWTFEGNDPIETEIVGYWTVEMNLREHPLAVDWPYRVKNDGTLSNDLAAAKELEVLND